MTVRPVIAVAAACLACAAAAPALAGGAAHLAIYPPKPDPRLPILMKASGIPRDPQPVAGYACDGAEPAPAFDLNADDGAPLVWDFEPDAVCHGQSATTAVYDRDGTELARTTFGLRTPTGVRVTPYLWARDELAPFMRPLPSAISPKASVRLEGVGFPPKRHVRVEVALRGSRRGVHRCKLREAQSGGRTSRDGVMDPNIEVDGAPAEDFLRFCPGRSYRVRVRDRDTRHVYAGFSLRVRH